MDALSTPLLILVFAAAALAVWIAGVSLSGSTDALDRRLGIGSALGGLVLLALATSLPELAITVSAAIRGNLDLAIGNLIGGIAIQTVVLAIVDAGTGRERPLTYLVGSLVLVLEALTVMAVAVAAVMSTQLPSSANVAGASPGSMAIVLIWVGGLLLVNRARRGIPWRVEAPGSRPGRTHRRAPHTTRNPPFAGEATGRVALVFGIAALVTLAAGVAIEESGNALAGRAGVSGGVFGATVIAAATALPEVSTGLAAVRLGDNQLAMSDIFGGNAFMPTLFLLADLIAGHPTLPRAHPSDIFLAALGVLVTSLYALGLILRPQRCFGRLGPDSIAVIAVYALGVIGLVAIGS